MEISFEVVDKTLIVIIDGELDHHTSEESRKKIDEKIMRTGVRNIIFDLSHMTFMDSSGVGLFMGRYKKIKEKNGLSFMINVQSFNRRLIKMSGLFNIYREYDKLEDALNAVGERKR